MIGLGGLRHTIPVPDHTQAFSWPFFMRSLVDSFMPSPYFYPEFNMALDCRIEESQPVKLRREGGRASSVLDGESTGCYESHIVGEERSKDSSQGFEG